MIRGNGLCTIMLLINNQFVFTITIPILLEFAIFLFYCDSIYIINNEEAIDMGGTHDILGQKIRNLREDFDLTQKDLSQMIGLTPKMISFYENNQRTPPVDILIKLSQIFHVSIDYLLGIDTSSVSITPLTWKKVKNTFPNAVQLNDEEKDMLEYYQHLSLRDKRWIMGQIIDLQKKSEESPTQFKVTGK